MEKKLLSRSEVVVLGSAHSKLSLDRKGGVRFSRRLHSCGGRDTLVQIFSTTARTVNQDIDSSSKRKLLFGNDSTRIFATNGAYLRSSSREGYVLDAYEDEYDGIVINSERLPWNAKAFSYALQTSLCHWKKKGKKGVWLKLPLGRSELVPLAVKEGFNYHHAEKEYVMLTYWISEGPNMLPDNASHQVGVGGFVINDKNEVLVVQEKHCNSTLSDVWKLPTGFILESEEIFTGAVREVKEETGIDAEFVEVVAFRHAHRVAFGKSDLFFICLLRSLSSQIEVDGLEIKAAKWMPLVEFIEQPCIQGDSMFKKIIEICVARIEKRYCGLFAHQVISKFDGKTSTLYYNVSVAQDFNCVAA